MAKANRCFESIMESWEVREGKTEFLVSTPNIFIILPDCARNFDHQKILLLLRSKFQVCIAHNIVSVKNRSSLVSRDSHSSSLRDFIFPSLLPTRAGG